MGATDAPSGGRRSRLAPARLQRYAKQREVNAPMKHGFHSCFMDRTGVLLSAVTAAAAAADDAIGHVNELRQ